MVARARGMVCEERHLLRVPFAFIAIGHEPNTQLFAGQLRMSAGGKITTSFPAKTRRHICATSRPDLGWMWVEILHR